MKKLLIFFGIVFILFTIGSFFFTGYITKMISDPEKMSRVFEKLGNGKVGNQPTQWESGAFSPDGNYYVYTYYIQTITQFSQRGGSTFRSGPVKYYLQVTDAATGIPLFNNPVEMGDMPVIMEIEDNKVWLSTRYYERKFTNPELYIIGDKQLKFTAEDFIKLNPAIPLDEKGGRTRYIQNKTGQSGAVIEATDGRQYLVNAETGKFTKVNSTTGYLDGKEDKDLQTMNAVYNLQGYKAEGGTRKNIVKEDRTRISSADDFIDPKFLVLKKEDGNEKAIPAIYNNHLFVLTSASIANSKDMQLSMLDKDNLKTVWTIDLPQSKQKMDSYDCERFAITGNQMRLANKTHFLLIDLDKGAVSKTTSLYPEN